MNRFREGVMAIAPCLLAQVAYAHPGHLHPPGPIHGLSWIDFLAFLLAALVVPGLVFLVAQLRARHPSAGINVTSIFRRTGKHRRS